jgi:hypothetical protein
MAQNTIVLTKTESKSEAATLAHQYQRKTDKQHILDNPDTYIGSVENVDATMWVYDDEAGGIVNRDIHYIPGTFSISDPNLMMSNFPSSLITYTNRVCPE